MNPIHLHLLLNHFPTVGSVIAIGLYLLALAKNNDDLKRAALATFVVIALLSIPAFLSGYAAREAVLNNPNISLPLLNAHMDGALLSLIVMEITGVFAWIGVWRFRPNSPAPR